MPPKKDFLAKAKASSISKTIELLGMKVVVRALSVQEMETVYASCLLPGKSEADGEVAYDNKKVGLHMIASCVFDENGNRLIPEGREDELRDLPHSVYQPLQSAVLKLNGLSAEGNA